MRGCISRNELHASASLGNFAEIFRSASSIICGEIIGVMSFEKQAATITPAAPVGELNPARSALVSRNTLDLFCIGSAPYQISGFFGGAQYDFFGIERRNRTLLFWQTEIRQDFHLLYFLLQAHKLLE